MVRCRSVSRPRTCRGAPVPPATTSPATPTSTSVSKDGTDPTSCSVLEDTVTAPDPTAADRRWLAATWPFVRQHLPPPPCRVLDIGWRPLGGFVPALRTDRYDAEGIDPEAPHGPHYHRIEFEGYAAGPPVAAMVACTSLHRVADLDTVIDLIAQRLEPGGVLVVVEWARERFDEATARWCFARLTGVLECRYWSAAVGAEAWPYVLVAGCTSAIC